jgi:hypothetical protein
MLYFYGAGDTEPGKIYEVGTSDNDADELYRWISGTALEQFLWLNGHPGGRTELKWV